MTMRTIRELTPTAVVAAALLGLLAVLILFAPASPAAAQSPPGVPSSVTITRANGTLTATWPAVNGAAK